MRASEAVVTGERRPIGYFQISAATLAANTSLKSAITTAMNALMQATGLVPGYAVIQQNVVGASVRWRDDGTAPTASVGMLLAQGELDYAGSIYDISFIVSVGAPILDVTIYG